MKEIYIERRNKLLRVGVKENKKLMECFIDEEDDAPYPGQIYKGIVKNIIPAIKCAFIDIGFKKNCYMYMDNKFNNTKIKKGQEVIVEIIKEDMGDKGPKVTNAFSIPGRYCVLNTLDRSISISKKINESEFIERARLKIQKPEDIGVTVRTNAQNVDIDVINSEIEILYDVYTELVRKAQYSVMPGLLYSDEGVIDRILRDSEGSEFYKIYSDNEKDYNHILNYLKNKSDSSADVILYDEQRTLFDFYGIEKEILQLRNSKVYLKCGGYIIIEKTEAAFVIDVNSGKNIKARNIEETAFDTNMEAALEIGRQIRLRNLSGIILIDFIDVSSESMKGKIINGLKESFYGDKNKTVIYPFTELNLVQIARRRRGRSITSFMEEDCSCCGGKGTRINYSYMKIMIKNEMLKINIFELFKDIYIEISSVYKTRILEDKIGFLKAINGEDKNIHMKFLDKPDYLKVEALLFEEQLHKEETIKLNG